MATITRDDRTTRRHPFAPDSIDLLVYASTGLNDHAFWSPACKIQESIGARGAFCFELSNGCNSLSAALQADHLDRRAVRRRRGSRPVGPGAGADIGP